MAATARDEDFYMTLVTFKVEDVLFRVSMEPFLTHSETFRDMFSLPHTGHVEMSSEGKSDNTPIILEGIKAADFKALLSYLYPKMQGTCKFSQSEWIGIHALAHMWGFEDARTSSKAYILSMNDAVTKLELGVKFGYNDCRRQAYEDLITRLHSLSVEEAMRIGDVATAQITQLREVRLKSMVRPRLTHDEQMRCPHCLTPIKRIGIKLNPSLNMGLLPGQDYTPMVEHCKTCDINFSMNSNDHIVSERINKELSKLFGAKAQEDGNGNGANRINPFFHAAKSSDAITFLY